LARKKQIEPIGPVYEIAYSRYAATGFGRVIVFVPITKFKDEESAVAWAKTFPDKFRAFFENRANDVEWPATP
jgi:hypothetical protein